MMGVSMGLTASRKTAKKKMVFGRKNGQISTVSRLGKKN